jgi:hypothetical protein
MNMRIIQKNVEDKKYIILHTYMPLYTMIYTTSCILASSDTLRKEQVGSMIINREFIHVDTEMNLRNGKRLQALKTDDYRRVIFTKCMD